MHVRVRVRVCVGVCVRACVCVCACGCVCHTHAFYMQHPSGIGRSATPTSSPRVSPKASPRGSPHGSPRASPVPSRHIRQHSSPSVALQSTDAGSHQADQSRANHSPLRSRTQSGGEVSSRLVVKSSSDIPDRNIQLSRSSEIMRQRPKDLRASNISSSSSYSPTSSSSSSSGDIKLVSWIGS